MDLRIDSRMGPGKDIKGPIKDIILKKLLLTF